MNCDVLNFLVMIGTQISLFKGPNANEAANLLSLFYNLLLLHQVQAACHPVWGANHSSMSVPLHPPLLLVHRQHPHKLLKVDEPVVVEVGQPDHQLDVLLQEALSKVEHAHAELFFRDLSVTVSIKGPGMQKKNLR